MHGFTYVTVATDIAPRAGLDGRQRRLEPFPGRVFADTIERRGFFISIWLDSDDEPLPPFCSCALNSEMGGHRVHAALLGRELIEREARVYARVGVQRGFQSFLHRTVRQLNHKIKPNPIPPITPYVSISIVTDVLSVLSANAAQEMMLPAIQTARHPNLFASADTTGPALRYIPLSKLPTHATVPLPSPKYTTNSFRNTPNVYAIPSTIMLHMKDANTITQPYLRGEPDRIRESFEPGRKHPSPSGYLPTVRWRRHVVVLASSLVIVRRWILLLVRSRWRQGCAGKTTCNTDTERTRHHEKRFQLHNIQHHRVVCVTLAVLAGAFARQPRRKGELKKATTRQAGSLAKIQVNPYGCGCGHPKATLQIEHSAARKGADKSLEHHYITTGVIATPIPTHFPRPGRTVNRHARPAVRFCRESRFLGTAKN
uniref:Uncharacterized protein n=1 Tax=Anopheles farauti TaxID=69004 RepID=A0A182Q997_9DIPT